MLTIAYITSRKRPRWEWFADSLSLELRATPMEVKIVVVDFHLPQASMRRACPVLTMCLQPGVVEFNHVSPKPTVWQGEGRLTTENYFAPANARNTALCLAPDGVLAYVDDLSVLMPGWLAAVKQAVEGNYLVYGAYKKVLALDVRDGKVLSYREHAGGIDSRWAAGEEGRAVPINPAALFGCSVAGPVEAFLRINGWDEDCDSMGGEDSLCGLMLWHAGYRAFYDRRMLTLESEEDHLQEQGFKRIIKKMANTDASHVILNQVMAGRRRVAPNYFGQGGIRGLRQRVLAGEPFPPATCPEHDWRDGQPLREM